MESVDEFVNELKVYVQNNLAPGSTTNRFYREIVQRELVEGVLERTVAAVKAGATAKDLEEAFHGHMYNYFISDYPP